MSRPWTFCHNGNLPVFGLSLSWALLVTGCTGSGVTETAAPNNSSGKNRPPVVTSATILDEPLSQAAPAAVRIYSEDPEREPVTYQYQWYVNEAPVLGQTSPTLSSEYFHRGQRVSVVIVPSDSVQKGHPYKAEAVLVRNAPPSISKVELQSNNDHSRVEAIVESNDPDHDRVDLTYRWVQGERVIQEGEESFLTIAGLNTQLPLVVEVTARDNESVSKPLHSSPLGFANHAPSIVSLPPVASGIDVYDYTVKALDKDGDPITFHLEKGPPGMTVDENTGHLHWVIPADHVGVAHVKVLAKDAPGSLAYQEFDLTLSRESPLSKPTT